MLRQVLFISDLHLTVSRPNTLDCFLRFIGQIKKGSQLYILGDLFDTYLGDDDFSIHNQTVKNALKYLTESGTTVFFQVGNRDFLIGKSFLEETGAILLAEYTIITLCGVRTLLTHGDLLCTDDSVYQKVRETIRTDVWKQSALSKPLWMRRLYGRWYRTKSTFHKNRQYHTIMDVNAETVARAFCHYDVSLMIHGHTHQSAVHHLEIDGRPRQRFVLPEWTDKGGVLMWNDGQFQQETIL